MRFGKIDYINLLPFYVFIKQYRAPRGFKKFMQQNRSYPAKINARFANKQIDAAFISSIAARGKKCTDAAIIAEREVWSVLVLPGESSKDRESATSNLLARKLGVEGQVLIGDKALKRFLENSEDVIDLAAHWHQRYSAPFVFARLCYNKNGCFYKKLAREFLKTRVKIPHYILEEYARSRGIEKKDIKAYLKRIKYRFGPKEQRALKKFYSL